MSIDERYMRRISGERGSARVQSIPSAMQVKIKREHSIIKDFLAQKDVPAWFRGTSLFQMRAADALFNAIRDDCQQGTAHRVRQCLTVIGVTPLVSDELLRFLMTLSRGNDIAFLWFLMEMVYKTPQSKREIYSINEQLLMSAIAHLDMVTTVRELDRILPRGPSKKQYDKQQRALKKLEQRSKIKKRPKAPKHEMPYFNKIKRPRMFGKDLNIKAPNYRVNYPTYEHYSNANYMVPNESNRWYAHYRLKTSNRVANVVLVDTIDTAIFGPTEGQIVAASVINIGLDKAFEFKDQHKTILCRHHQLEEDNRELKKMERLVTAREQCLKKLELFSFKKKRRYDEVMAKLEAEIDVYTTQYRRKLQERYNDKSYVRVISNNCVCEYLIRDSDRDNCTRPAEDCSGGVSMPRLTGGAEKPSPHRTRSKKCNCDVRLAGGTETSGKRSSRFSTDGLKPDGARSCGNKHLFDCLNKASISEIKTRASNLHDYRYAASDTPSSSQMFFEAPDENKPYKFNYDKIFRYNWLDDDRAKIKGMCVEALDSGAGKVPKLTDKTPDLGQIVLDTANKDWEKELHKWRVGYDEKREAQGLPSGASDENPDDGIPKLDYYDCNDENLMLQMLKAALKIMSRNPKFVLASMPEASKLPFLREWMLSRYGKTYTRKERQDSYNLSVKIFRALEKVALRVKLPPGKAMGPMMTVDYSCRNYVEKKAKLVKKQFEDRFYKTIMEETRIFWFAMRPYLCTAGPPRNTYFAYMPSRVLDITYFRPWKPSEFMNAKVEWERRLQNKRMMENID